MEGTKLMKANSNKSEESFRQLQTQPTNTTAYRRISSFGKLAALKQTTTGNDDNDGYVIRKQASVVPMQLGGDVDDDDVVSDTTSHQETEEAEYPAIRNNEYTSLGRTPPKPQQQERPFVQLTQINEKQQPEMHQNRRLTRSLDKKEKLKAFTSHSPARTQRASKLQIQDRDQNTLLENKDEVEHAFFKNMSKIKNDENASFQERMDFDVYKRNTKLRRLDKIMGLYKRTIQVEEKEKLFERLIEDSQRRKKVKERVEKYQEITYTSRSKDKKQTRKESENFFRKQIEQKKQKEMKLEEERERKKFEEEVKIIDEMRKSVSKGKQTLRESTQTVDRLLQDAARRKKHMEITQKMKDHAEQERLKKMFTPSVSNTKNSTFGRSFSNISFQHGNENVFDRMSKDVKRRKASESPKPKISHNFSARGSPAKTSNNRYFSPQQNQGRNDRLSLKQEIGSSQTSSDSGKFRSSLNKDLDAKALDLWKDLSNCTPIKIQDELRSSNNFTERSEFSGVIMQQELHQDQQSSSGFNDKNTSKIMQMDFEDIEMPKSPEKIPIPERPPQINDYYKSAKSLSGSKSGRSQLSASKENKTHIRATPRKHSRNPKMTPRDQNSEIKSPKREISRSKDKVLSPRGTEKKERLLSPKGTTSNNTSRVVSKASSKANSLLTSPHSSVKKSRASESSGRSQHSQSSQIKHKSAQQTKFMIPKMAEQAINMLFASSNTSRSSENPLCKQFTPSEIYQESIAQAKKKLNYETMSSTSSDIYSKMIKLE